MKTNLRTIIRKLQVLPSLVLTLSLLAWTGAHAQITPSADSYTNTADSTTNYGSKTLLDVDAASQITYIQFNLASIPTTASVSQATLKLYVNGVTTAGSFNVDYINSAWSESTIDASNAPPLGAAIASNVNVTTAEKNQYILVNVTSAVLAWLSGSEANNGLALVANSTFNATFDSKENTTTSHAPELDIAFAGGEGTITGVTTASGSGLTGGGTSGTLNLSLTNACATNQVLQWNGSIWACAAVGTGTITGVTAGTGLTGGGSSGAITLNLDTTKVPLLAAANTFTGNQTVNGNLSATGIVSGTSFEIGSDLFAFGSYANGNTFLGFAGNTTTTGGGNTASGVYALGSNTTGWGNTATGFKVLQQNTTGVENTASGTYALNTNTSGWQNTAVGSFALQFNTTGYANTASGYEALVGNTTATGNTASGTLALSSNTTGSNNSATGFQALAANTWGISNTASGAYALMSNSTGNGNTSGSYNTASGYFAGATADGSNLTGSNNSFLGANTALSTGALNDATAIGNNAEVSVSNAIVLGSILGTNNCQAASGCGNTSVGIGTTAPAATLHLDLLDNGGSGASDSLLIGNTSSRGLELSDGGGSGVNIASFGVPLLINNSGQNTVLNPSGGIVGIGMSSPSNILTVAPGRGPAIADGWTTYSSRRWKTNIQTLPNALAKVQQLRGVSYDLKDSGKHEIGVIAEEVGAVVPELVSYEANGKDARGVDYARLTALLIEATKQQQREFQRQQNILRASIRELKSELRQTRESLQKIKAQIGSAQPALNAENALWASSPQTTKHWKEARSKATTREAATTAKP